LIPDKSNIGELNLHRFSIP